MALINSERITKLTLNIKLNNVAPFSYKDTVIMGIGVIFYINKKLNLQYLNQVSLLLNLKTSEYSF